MNTTQAQRHARTHAPARPRPHVCFVLFHAVSAFLSCKSRFTVYFLFIGSYFIVSLHHNCNQSLVYPRSRLFCIILILRGGWFADHGIFAWKDSNLSASLGGPNGWTADT